VKKKIVKNQAKFNLSEEKLRLMCKIQPLINDPSWTTLPLANVKSQPRFNLVYCLTKLINIFNLRYVFGLFKSLT